MSFDVLKEADPGSEKSNAICNPRPEVPRVLLSFALPGCAEGLTGISASEDVHAVTKRSPREGLKIRPDRCWVHESRFHFRNQICDGEGFDLTKSDCAQIWDDSFESKLNPAVSSAQANVCNCFGNIHVPMSVQCSVDWPTRSDSRPRTSSHRSASGSIRRPSSGLNPWSSSNNNACDRPCNGPLSI